MSAAEHQSPNVPSQADDKPLSPPPKRPSLLQPPPRPQAPAATPSVEVEAVVPAQPSAPQPDPEPVSDAAPEAQADVPAVDKPAFTNHPIAPPSEPMQYRAIGLVRGTYQPSEEQLNRGTILADDGAAIDAVLLGRVTSLIKKHIDLASSHLWVVYPRTRQPLENSEAENAESSDSSLHLQVVGVWEPETLGMPGENPKTKSADEEGEDASTEVASPQETEDLATTEAPDTESASKEVAVPAAKVPSENYFSIRGEVLKYDEDSENILVKIVQSAKRSGKPPKAFKLNVLGSITGKTVGYFWDLEVERQGEQLVLTEGHSIGIVPPKKRKKGKPSGPRRGRRLGHGSMGHKPRPAPNKEKPRIRPSAPVKSNPL